MPAVALKPATDTDWPLIRAWLAKKSVQNWWGPQATIEAEVMMALASPHAICRLISVDGEAVGYAHAFDAALWGENLPDGLAPGTWDLDLFIASERHRGQGIGQQAVAMLRDEVFATTFAIAVCVFPSIANERAVRAYERAGFKWQRVIDDPVQGRAWFMVAERG